LKQIFSYLTNNTDILLDSFAGSGTTAHAVLDINKEDGGNRKFFWSNVKIMQIRLLLRE
jgi:adenine-specific DNA-methyltransferase